MELRLGGAQFDVPALVAEIIEARRAGAGAEELALGMHAALARASAGAAAALADEHGITRVALTGGVFQNDLLARLTRAELVKLGLDVLEHERVPANDGGLALGQALVAGRLAAIEGGE